MTNQTAIKQGSVTTPRRDLHQQVTDTIITQLENGTVPWHKRWKSESDVLTLPKNGTTGNKYRGINILLLWSSALLNDFGTQEWATFKQWNEKKEAIRKGEKGSLVVYYDIMEKDVDGETKEIPFLKSSYVFNRSQLVSYQPNETPEPTKAASFERLQRVDQFIDATQAIIEYKGSRACYIPSQDKICMPATDFLDTETCTAQEGYYSTLIHELVHWSGAEKRLNRTKGKKFGDNQYAMEELVAELGAAFTCAEFEIGLLPKGEHASYIASWLKVLRDNKQCIFTAASEASKAVQYLHTLQPA